MKNENRMKELKVACSHALGNYCAAAEALGTAYDNYYVDSDCWEAYSAAHDNSKALWEVYRAAEKACEEAEKE